MDGCRRRSRTERDDAERFRGAGSNFPARCFGNAIASKAPAWVRVYAWADPVLRVLYAYIFGLRGPGEASVA